MARSRSTVLTYSFFSLAQGNRITVPRTRPSTVVVSTSNTVTNFMNYVTTFQCRLNDFLGADGCVYSLPNDTPLLDNTVVSLVGRVCTSAGGMAIIDVTHLTPFLGDLSDPSYDDHIPDVSNPYVVILGVVVGNGEELVEGARAFKVEARARMCGQLCMSIIKYIVILCVYLS